MAHGKAVHVVVHYSTLHEAGSLCMIAALALATLYLYSSMA